jgi:hypothetical protein
MMARQSTENSIKSFPTFEIGKFDFQLALFGQIANSRVTRSK